MGKKRLNPSKVSSSSVIFGGIAGWLVGIILGFIAAFLFGFIGMFVVLISFAICDTLLVKKISSNWIRYLIDVIFALFSYFISLIFIFWCSSVESCSFIIPIINDYWWIGLLFVGIILYMIGSEKEQTKK